jgi:protein MpaA
MKESEMRRTRSAVLAGCALLTILALAGCYQPVRFPVVVDAPTEPTIVPAVARYEIVGKSVQGRPMMSLALGRGPDVTFILATIHGHEPAGTPLVRRLSTHLRQNPGILNGRKVVLLRLANPDGLVHNSRFNAHGVDLNRNFDAANRQNTQEFGRKALSEPESRAIERMILQHQPDRIVSVHQRDPGNPGCIDYDGPAADLANHMADHCDLPVTRLGSMPGSLGSYAGLELGIPIITFEMNRADSRLDSETLWQKYGKALLAAIVYPDRLE